MSFFQQTFPIFIALAVIWVPNFDLCCKSVILTSVINNHIKIVSVFFTQQTFSISIPLAVTWGPNFGPCCKSVILTRSIEIHIKVVSVFYYQHQFSIFIPLAPLDVPTWILEAKV